MQTFFPPRDVVEGDDAIDYVILGKNPRYFSLSLSLSDFSTFQLQFLCNYSVFC